MRKINIFAKIFRILIRIVEHYNWVFISIFISVLALVITFISLNRETTLREFITQKREDASNISLTWLMVSVVFWVQVSILYSQYLPIVPIAVENINLLGLSLNKLGYTLVVFGAFYVVKIIFSFFFYSSINQLKSFTKLQFIASRVYFVGSIVMMILVFINYYIDVDKVILLPILLCIQLILFIFKIISYFISGKENLPIQWYYKLLYICTLQIAPIFALWRLIFFN